MHLPSLPNVCRYPRPSTSALWSLLVVIGHAILLEEVAHAQAGRIDPKWSAPLVQYYNQVLPLSDGGLFVLGPFGSRGAGERPVSRLLPNGQLDPDFVTTLTFERNDYIQGVLQADEKLILFGTKLDGSPILLRLNTDGTQDDAFKPGTAWSGSIAEGGAVVNSAGEIFLAGTFEQYQGKLVGKPIRLTASGGYDKAFATGTNPDLVCSAIADAGERRLYAAQMRNDIVPRPYSLVRLKPNGSPDPSFAAVATDNVVHQILVLPSGQIVISGSFTQVNGNPIRNHARISPTGELLTIPVLPSRYLPDVSVKGVFSDGGLLLAYQTWLVRVHPDGTVDNEWGVLPDGSRPFMRVQAAAVGPNDRVFVNFGKDEIDPPGNTHRLTTSSDGGPGRPKILKEPALSTVVGLGNRLELWVEMDGDGPFTYRWGGDQGWLGSESDDPVFAIASVDIWNAGYYYVEVKGPGGTRLSRPAKVGVSIPVSGLTSAPGGLTGRIETVSDRPISVEYLPTLDGSPWEQFKQITGDGQPQEVTLPADGATGFYRFVVY